jgi:hypothetical protein
VKRVNIADPAFTYDPEHLEGFRVGTFRIRPLVNSDELGTSVYELAPGWTGNGEDDLIVHRASGVDYWSGEPGTQR